MAGADDNHNAERLVKIELDDPAGPRRSAEAEQERAIAIYDILEENQFGVPEHEGPFHLYLKLEVHSPYLLLSLELIRCDYFLRKKSF